MNKQGNNTGSSSDRPVMSVPSLNGKEIMREIPIDQMSRDRLEAELQSAWNMIKLQQHWVNTSFEQKNELKTALYAWIQKQTEALKQNTVEDFTKAFMLVELKQWVDKQTGNDPNNTSVVPNTIGTRQPEMLYKDGE